MRNLVIGLDGRAASIAALEWAARTAGTEGTVHVVIALSDLVDPTTGHHADDRTLFEGELANWTSSIVPRVGELTTCVATATASELLLAEGADRAADAIVIGAHVPASFVPPTIGRTARCLLDSLDRPLIVVPEHNETFLDGGAPIGAGVGHGDATDAAIRWAAKLAEEREIELGLVRATDEGPVFNLDGFLDLLTYYIDPSQRDAWDREDVEAMVGVAQSATVSKIAVNAAAVDGHPADRLVDASVAASLLVIGLHRPLVPGLHYTSRPLRHALTNATCPVAVVPMRRAPRRTRS